MGGAERGIEGRCKGTLAGVRWDGRMTLEARNGRQRRRGRGVLAEIAQNARMLDSARVLESRRYGWLREIRMLTFANKIEDATGSQTRRRTRAKESRWARPQSTEHALAARTRSAGFTLSDEPHALYRPPRRDCSPYLKRRRTF